MSLLEAVFATLLTLYVVYAVIINRRHKKTSSFMSKAFICLTQVPVVVIAVWLAFRYGVVNRSIISPPSILAGLIAGHLIFGLSLLLTLHSVKDAADHFLDIGSLWDFTVDKPYVLSKFIAVAIAEELVYRVAAQPLAISFIEAVTPLATTASTWLGIVAIAVVFSAVHRHFFKNEIIVSTEFLIFALLLGALYYLTGSLILVIVIHAIRDIEIAYLDYLVKLNDTGDEERASQEFHKELIGKQVRHT